MSDVPLNFTTRDYAFSRLLQEKLAEIAGDPDEDRDKLMAISPAFRVDEIETPVFLIYGRDDLRVHPDHSQRMMLMLDLYGKEWDSLEIEVHGAFTQPSRMGDRRAGRPPKGSLATCSRNLRSSPTRMWETKA